MIIVIDNYDSFTQNLVQCVGENKKCRELKVIRNDEVDLNKLYKLNPTHIILSPGPGKPQDSGICLEILNSYANQIPILGVCLGHQTIGHVYGADIKKLIIPVHGKTSNIFHEKTDLFNKVPSPFIASRYHSLIINETNIPNNLSVTAWTKEGIIMGCQHKIYKRLRGLQFHPESLWTSYGNIIINNFLSS